MNDFLDIETKSGDIHADRYNTTLYTFAGTLSMHNHVFIETSANEETRQPIGAYVFPQHGDTFKQLVEMISEHDFPMILNSNTVPECDQNALVDILTQNEDLYAVPEDWENEQSA